MRLDGELLRSLQEGMFDKPLWSGFLKRLRARANGSWAALIFRSPDDDNLLQFTSGISMPAHIARLFHEQYARDPLPYHQMREGRIYAIEELINPDAPLSSASDADVIRPQGMTQTRLVRVTEPGGLDGWLGCDGARNAGAAVGALLAGLVPHLRSTLRVYAALERERFRSAVTTEAFHRLNFGWMSLDAQCRILDMTPHIEKFFEHSQVLRRNRYGRLVPVSPVVDRQLTALVKQFAIDADAPPKAINLSRDPLADMLLSPVRAPSHAGQGSPVAIAYVSGDRLSKADRCDQLADLFGLLPSEARLAWAIAQGLSISEAAAELGLTTETARTYSKKIYAKTGTHGQAGLVRTILMSVLSLA